MAGKSLEELNELYGGTPAKDGRRHGGMMGGGRGPMRGMNAHGKPQNMGKVIGRLLSYIGKYKYLLIVVLLCMATSTAVSLYGSYMLRPIINSIDDSLYKPTVGENEVKASGLSDINAKAEKENAIYLENVSLEDNIATVNIIINSNSRESFKFSIEYGKGLELESIAFPDKNSAIENENDIIYIKNEDSVTVISKEGAEVQNGIAAICKFKVGLGDTSVSFSSKNTKQNVIEALVKILAVLAFVYLLGVIATYLQSRIMLTVSQNAVEKLRNDLFTKMQKLPIRLYDTKSTGELMSRYTNDVDNVGVMLDNSLISLFSGSITLVGTLAMMIYTNIWLTLITVAFIPIFAFGGAAIGKLSRKYYSAQQAALGAVNGYIEESVTGQKVVKVFNHENVCIDEFGKLNEYMRDKQVGAQFWGGVMGPIMGNTSKISYAITAGIGGVLCILKGFDVGGLSIFVNYSSQFSRPVNELSMQMATVFSALAGAERVFALMDSEPEDADPEDAVSAEGMKGYVKFENVSFGYNPDKLILKNISLYAKPGQKIAFVGSTGAGKTTVTNLLSRFYDIKEGKITIDDIDIYKYKRSELRKNIAMVLQDTHLFTGTVMENIRYGRPDATDEEVIAAAKAASADVYITKLADGYNTMLEGDGANLSQGQRQLLNIARASLSKAPILVLDEATSSVDTRTEQLIGEGMAKLMENRTTFVIAHRLSTIRDANAIMVLEHGEIIERGTQEELLAQKGRYYELYTGKRELD